VSLLSLSLPPSLLFLTRYVSIMCIHVPHTRTLPTTGVAETVISRSSMTTERTDPRRLMGVKKRRKRGSSVADARAVGTEVRPRRSSREYGRCRERKSHMEAALGRGRRTSRDAMSIPVPLAPLKAAMARSESIAAYAASVTVNRVDRLASGGGSIPRICERGVREESEKVR